jgi:integrase
MALPRGIRIRGGKFHVDVSVKDKGRMTGTFDTLDEAKLKQVEWRAALVKGQVPAAARPVTGGWTVGEAITKTFEAAWAGTKSEQTFRKLEGQIIDYWGKSRPLGSITTTDLDAWVEHLKAKGNSDATINRKLAFLSKLFTVALPRKGVGTKPKFPRRKEYNGRIRFLSPDEERRVIDALVQWGQDEAHDAVVVLLDTGLRTGELFRLEGRDLDLTTNKVTVWEAKSGEARSIPLTVRARMILEQRAKDQRGKLFPSGYWALRAVWERVRSHLGLSEDDQFVLHALRHTFVSRLVQSGAGLPVAKKLAGHKTLAVTMRYAHLAPDDLAENHAIRALEAMQKDRLRQGVRV